jgi:hypothetical protein
VGLLHSSATVAAAFLGVLTAGRIAFDPLG